MPVLYPLEALFRKCNKYHGDEFWEPGVFLPDVDDFNNQKRALATERQTEPEPQEPVEEEEETQSEPPQLAPEELDELRKIYNKHKDDDGLPGERGTRAAHEAGASPSLAEEDEFREKHKTKKATFAEFKEYVERTRHPEDQLDDLCTVFEYWDREKTGKVKSTYFAIALTRFQDKLTPEEAVWIALNFTSPDANDFVDYRDAIRRLMEDPSSMSGAPPPAERTQEPAPTETAPPPPPPPEDPINLIFEANQAPSPSGNRRRTSKFTTPLHLANLAHTKDDLPMEKEYLTKQELGVVVAKLVARNQNEEGELLKYFEYYDPKKSGTVDRKVAIWQVQAWADSLTPEQADQVVGMIEGDRPTVNYQAFIKRLVSRPENSSIYLKDEQTSQTAQQMESTQDHNAELPCSVYRSTTLASITESLGGEAETHELRSSSTISMVLTRRETSIQM